MSGRLFDSLSYKVRRELRTWRSNVVMRRNASSWFVKLIMVTARYPIRIPASMTTLTVSAFAVTAIINHEKFIAEQSELYGSILTVLLGVQATLAGIVYPVVIGLVALFLQRRHSAKASLSIYLHSSAAIVTGASALLLITVMTIQLFMIRVLNIKLPDSWLLGDTIWFLVNLGGALWFAIRTFDFLRPDRRARIIREYALHWSLPQELRGHLQRALFYVETSRGLLPDTNDTTSPGRVEVVFGARGGRTGKPQVVIRAHKHPLLIKDVRLRLLRVVAVRWYRRAHRAHADSTSDRATAQLIFPIEPGEVLDGDVALCRVANGPALERWERWLIRMAYVLRKADRNSKWLRTTDILQDLRNEAEVAIERNEETAFQETLADLIDLHTALLQATQRPRDDQPGECLAILADQESMFGTPLYETWMRAYYELSERAVSSIERTTRYVEYLSYVPSRLIVPLQDIRPKEVISAVLSWAIYTHRLLNQWWANASQQHGVAAQSPCEPFRLRDPAGSSYTKAISALVSGWEIAKNDIYLGRTRREHSNLTADDAVFYAKHVEGTALMLMECVRVGNSEGAEWFCDSLIKWPSCAVLRGRYGLIVQEEPWDATLFQSCNNPVTSQIGASNSDVAEHNDASRQSEYVKASLMNYWRDIVVVVMSVLAKLTRECACDKSLPADMLSALFQGKQLREGSEAHRAVTTTEDAIKVVARACSSTGYRETLENALRRIEDNETRGMIPGRVYVGNITRLEEYEGWQLLLLCLFARDGWTPSQTLLDDLREWGHGNSNGLARLTALFERWRHGLKNQSFVENEHSFVCIARRLGVRASFDEVCRNMDRALAQIKNAIING